MKASPRGELDSALKTANDEHPHPRVLFYWERDFAAIQIRNRKRYERHILECFFISSYRSIISPPSPHNPIIWFEFYIVIKICIRNESNLKRDEKVGLLECEDRNERSFHKCVMQHIPYNDGIWKLGDRHDVRE
jgi:hypothetical protein